VKNYGEWFGLNYAITYFYNAYGKNEIQEGSYATLIAKFAKLVRDGKILSVTLPGTQLRSFTHVDDIVDGLIRVGEDGVGDGYGIGSDTSYTVTEIALLFGGNFEFTPAKPGNRLSSELVTGKTKALGWAPKRNLSEYIQEIMKDIYRG
jgi:UDP-glucose 4-epimerase